jgi:hypothetical protein
MEPEVSLPSSVQPATGLHPEPIQFNPDTQPYFLRPILILSSHLYPLRQIYQRELLGTITTWAMES